MIGRRPKRILRLHVTVPKAAAGVDPIQSIEGIFIGYEAGHYKLANARHIDSPTSSQPLGMTWVPRDRVFFAQEVNA